MKRYVSQTTPHYSNARGREVDLSNKQTPTLPCHPLDVYREKRQPRSSNKLEVGTIVFMNLWPTYCLSVFVTHVAYLKNKMKDHLLHHHHTNIV